MKRGDVVVVALSGAYGKPRPALVMQDEAFSDIGFVAILPITSDLKDVALLRIPLQPDPSNRVRAPSRVMVDKIVSAPRQKIGRKIGSVDQESLEASRSP